jgi:hypothetical protein
MSAAHSSMVSVTLGFANERAAIDWYRYARRDTLVELASGLRTSTPGHDVAPLVNLVVDAEFVSEALWLVPPPAAVDLAWASHIYSAMDVRGPIKIRSEFADEASAVTWFTEARRLDYLPVLSGMRRASSPGEESGIVELRVGSDAPDGSSWVVPPPQMVVRERRQGPAVLAQPSSGSAGVAAPGASSIAARLDAPRLADRHAA